MPTVLHLSDIHLGEIDNAQIAGDYKNEIVPLSERVNRVNLLRNTLRELDHHLRKNNEVIDALVVSGDIAVANAESGFRQFRDVLCELGDSLPPAERILVVPGNHDVSWKTAPSSQPRYENFLNYVRSAGYVTPMLDGVDYVKKGSFDFTKHYIRGGDGSYVLVPINSSNYCGSLVPATHATDPFWDRVEKAGVPISEVAAVKKEVESLRLHDVARISPQQFENLRNLLLSLDPVSSSGFRIAVLHHHLLPVSTGEEFKSFESISNLGLLRNFLRANSFDLVLHGHKHMEHTYWDHISTFDGEGDRGREVLVISGATIGGATYNNRDICRLISIEGFPLATRIQLRHIPVAESGAGLESVRSRVISVWRVRQERETRPETLIAGDDFGVMFARLRSVFEAIPPQSELPLVMTSLSRPPSTAMVAQHYPDVLGVPPDKKEEWLRDLVSWWQRPETSLGGRLLFTHGSRIYRYHGSIDQLERVVKALENRDNSGRAVVLLLDPESDEIHTKLRKFPAFALAQFLIRDSGFDGLKLDCIGYFRKQEIRYWWAINILELATLQAEVVGRLQQRYASLRPGSITTVASLAFAGDTPPRVAVPAIDRALDENRDELWSLIYAVFWDGMPQRETYLRRWIDLLDDMIPPEEPARDGVPVALDGLKFIHDELRRFAKHHPDSELSDLSPLLEQLYQLNWNYASQSVFERPSRVAHTKWRHDVIGIVQKMKQVLEV